MSQLGGAINSSVEARYSTGDPNATLMLRRSLQVLNAILKEYAGFKMLTGVATMGKVRPYIQAQPSLAYLFSPARRRVTTTTSSSLL